MLIMRDQYRVYPREGDILQWMRLYDNRTTSFQKLLQLIQSREELYCDLMRAKGPFLNDQCVNGL